MAGHVACLSSMTQGKVKEWLCIYVEMALCVFIGFFLFVFFYTFFNLTAILHSIQY